MTRGRGELYRDVLAVMPEGVVLSTRTIADAVPNCSRALIGVTLCRAAKKGLVVRADAASGTQTGTKPGSWMRTAQPYVVGRGGGRPQPHKPHSRHRNGRTPPTSPPKLKPHGLVDCAISVPSLPLSAEGESVAAFLARGGRIQSLPGVAYVPPSHRPVGWKS